MFPKSNTLQLSYDGTVVEAKAAAQNCVKWNDVRDMTFFRDAPLPNEWIIAPNVKFDDASLHDSAMAFHKRHTISAHEKIIRKLKKTESAPALPRGTFGSILTFNFI